ncbi:MAG: hypothetical protein BWX66_01736 [Deltaproteobacteria bacterium ADurb.Bin058]|nr:MAG: hypothetical protein BWX66_01736 [Deltaproteobacteria bacterium ADurb.Bin058]
MPYVCVGMATVVMTTPASQMHVQPSTAVTVLVYWPTTINPCVSVTQVTSAWVVLALPIHAQGSPVMITALALSPVTINHYVCVTQATSAWMVLALQIRA